MRSVMVRRSLSDRLTDLSDREARCPRVAALGMPEVAAAGMVVQPADREVAQMALAGDDWQSLRLARRHLRVARRVQRRSQGRLAGQGKRAGREHGVAVGHLVAAAVWCAVVEWQRAGSECEGEVLGAQVARVREYSAGVDAGGLAVRVEGWCRELAGEEPL